MRWVKFVALFVPVWLATAGVAAAETRELGLFETWSAHMIIEGKARVCYIHGEPIHKRGKYKKRGPVFVQIAHRPLERTRNEVGFTAGYTYRKESEARVVIDRQRFVLFTDRETAWSRDAKSDTALVKAMMRGRRMRVRGSSARGTVTTDTYSLLGFTKAYRAIGKACGVR